MPSSLALRAALAAASVIGSLTAPPAEAAEPGQPHPAASAAVRHGAQVQAPHPTHQAPLHYDPPGAGPAPGSAAYEACIDHPSPDGLTMDCQALQHAVHAKPRRKR